MRLNPTNWLLNSISNPFFIGLVCCLLFTQIAFAQEVNVVTNNAIASETPIDNGSVTFTIDAISLTNTRILYEVTGTATNGVDYFNLSGIVTIVAGNLSVNRAIRNIVDDTFIEGNETVIVTILESADYTIGNNNTATVTILDNDTCGIEEPPELNQDLVTIFCGENIEQNLDDYVNGDPPPGSTLIWSISSDQSNVNAHLASSTITITSSATFYGFYYNEADTCAGPNLQINIVLNKTPEITEVFADETCGNGSVLLRATSSNNALINWYDTPTGGVVLGTGTSFNTPEIAETTTFYVEAMANGCASVRTEVIAIIYAQPNPGTPTDIDVCSRAVNGFQTVIDLDDQLEGEDPGTWEVTSQPANNTVDINDDNEVDFEGKNSGAYVFTFTTNGAETPCTDQSVSVTVTVSECIFDTDNDGLEDYIEDGLGTDPNNPDTDGDGIDDGNEVGDETDPLDACSPNLTLDCNPEEIDVQVTKVADKTTAVFGEEVVFTITLTNLTEDRIIDIVVNDIIDEVMGFRYISHEASVGDYNILNGNWEIEELLANEEHTLSITVEMLEDGSYVNVVSVISIFPEDFDLSNNQDSFTIATADRTSDECGFLFNQFSPNQDGTNDRLRINCIQDYPNNTISIFNRYGTEVYRKRNYDNSWEGTWKDGDLPKGTYYYILDLADGSEVKKGWIQLLR